MPTIAVVGAGPGLGMSIARLFGQHGFSVALISRNADKLDQRVADLTALDVPTAGFAADVDDRPGLVGALESAAAKFGGIDVLEYSPYAGLTPSDPTRVTVEDLQPHVESVLYGAVAATRTVLPHMLEQGQGTLLYTVGGGAIDPSPMLAAINPAQAGLRNWVHNLGKVVGDRGVHAATVAIGAFIGTEPPAPGIAAIPPDEIAQAYWELHEKRDAAERVLTG